MELRRACFNNQFGDINMREKKSDGGVSCRPDKIFVQRWRLKNRLQWQLQIIHTVNIKPIIFKWDGRCNKSPNSSHNTLVFLGIETFEVPGTASNEIKFIVRNENIRFCGSRTNKSDRISQLHCVR